MYFFKIWTEAENVFNFLFISFLFFKWYIAMFRKWKMNAVLMQKLIVLKLCKVQYICFIIFAKKQSACRRSFAAHAAKLLNTEIFRYSFLTALNKMLLYLGQSQRSYTMFFSFFPDFKLIIVVKNVVMKKS